MLSGGVRRVVSSLGRLAPFKGCREAGNAHSCAHAQVRANGAALKANGAALEADGAALGVHEWCRAC